MRVFTTILLLLTFVFPAFGQGLSPCNGATSITYQGYDYDIVEIGDQCWFAENLRATTFSNGDNIEYGVNTDLPGWQHYADDSQNSLIIGHIYNYAVVEDERNVCPSGWVIPSESMFSILYNYLDSFNPGFVGNAIKNSESDVPVWNGTNSSGFGGQPGGYIANNGTSYNYGLEGWWWLNQTDGTYYFYTYWGTADVISGNTAADDKSISIRCIKDEVFVQIPGCTDMQACNYNQEANFNDGSCLYAGDACDDGNEFTENDAYTTDCNCIGDEIEIVPGCTYETACNYNPDANQNDMSCLFPGDACDDNDVSTGNDAYNDECECIGEVLQGGCTYEAACNYDPEAEFDNNTCLFIGDPCDDDNPDTYDDVIQEDCECAGTPSTSVDELEALSVLIYPNPASNNLNVDLGDLEGEDVRIQLYDSSGKLVFEELRNSSVAIDVSTYASGLYSIVILTADVELKRQVVIE
jgi:uncharacterized protein (TIGR02145 family)